MAKNVCILAAALLLGALLAAGCKSQTRVPRTVLVQFEIQLINARATAWGYGRAGAGGEQGFGATNEVLKRSDCLSVGDPVFCKVFGEHFDRSDPAHQVICRILVQGDEAYVCADQGTPDRAAKTECGGPVYIPEKKRAQ